MSGRLRCLLAPRLAWVLLALLAGCRGIRFTPPSADRAVAAKERPAAAPAKYTLRVGQFVFLSDFELKSDQPIMQELAKLGDQVSRELELPAANMLIQVYLFEDRDRYETYMLQKYPDLPRRRAFFIAQPRPVGGAEDLLVYTYWGDRVREDLRHELTHALLHSVLKDVPLWLDEGLAEYFELPPERKGVNYHHLDQCHSESFKPGLARLEQLREVQQMSPVEYREAWAWVHLMLQSKPEARAALLGYLQVLRSSANAGPLQPRLAGVYPDLDAALVQHLDHLNGTQRPAPWVKR